MKKAAVFGLAILCLGLAPSAQAVMLTFDDAISGATTYSFDADMDTFPDAIFSTTDPAGFNTVGPGLNMSYINEPGLEGTTLLNPDLRVDFPVGAEGILSFGFALDTYTGGVYGCTFDVYDGSNALIATNYVLANYTTTPQGQSSFPEAILAVDLGTDVASYATFQFDGGQLPAPPRYIIDNFDGTFGTTERPIPEPGTLALCAMGLGALAARRRRRSA